MIYCSLVVSYNSRDDCTFKAISYRCRLRGKERGEGRGRQGGDRQTDRQSERGETEKERERERQSSIRGVIITFPSQRETETGRERETDGRTDRQT